VIAAVIAESDMACVYMFRRVRLYFAYFATMLNFCHDTPHVFWNVLSGLVLFVAIVRPRPMRVGRVAC
jgi:hypothetical protein